MIYFNWMNDIEWDNLKTLFYRRGDAVQMLVRM